MAVRKNQKKNDNKAANNTQAAKPQKPKEPKPKPKKKTFLDQFKEDVDKIKDPKLKAARLALWESRVKDTQRDKAAFNKAIPSGVSKPPKIEKFKYITEEMLKSAKEDEAWTNGKESGKIKLLPYKSFYVEVNTLEAFYRMASAAKKSDLTLIITSGFRTNEKQAELYNQRYTPQYDPKDPDNRKKGVKLAGKPTTAYPGYSNHQNGMAIDISTSVEIVVWLRANAQKYGFYETVFSEDWHWEFRTLPQDDEEEQKEEATPIADLQPVVPTPQPTSAQPQEKVSQEVAQAPQTYSLPVTRENTAKQTTTQEQKKEEFKTNLLDPIEDEDLKNAAISFYLGDIIDNWVDSWDENAEKPMYNNIGMIESGKNTSFTHNILFSKGAKTEKEGIENTFNYLSNLEISNFVPFIELYTVINAYDNVYVDVMYPFDDYTNKTKIDNIFYDKTGRGGNVGIKSVEWKTISQNPSNIAQISVKLKILIQDIQEIEIPRNGVTLLNFLYPAGAKRAGEFDPKNFNIKLKLGWKYKKENNDTLKDIDNKVEQLYLQEVLYATLFKHSFNFLDNGNVELDIEYIGMLETEISNPYHYNVLEKLSPYAKNFLKPAKGYKALLETLKISGVKGLKEFDTTRTRTFIKIFYNMSSLQVSLKEIDQAKEDWANDNYLSSISTFWSALGGRTAVSAISDGLMSWVGLRDDTQDEEKKSDNNTIVILENTPDNPGSLSFHVEKQGIEDKEVVNKLKEELEKAIKHYEDKEKSSYASAISSMFTSLANNKKIRYLALNNQQVSALKSISRYTNEMKNEDLKTFTDLVLDAQESFRKQKLRTVSKAALTGEANSGPPVEVNESGVNINVQEYEEMIAKSLLSTNAELSSDKESLPQIVVPYTTLGCVVEYFIELFYGKKNFIENKDLRIVFGTFSYRDFGSLTSDTAQIAAGKSNDITDLVKRDGRLFLRLSVDKKYANLADIPITLSSIMNWYNNSILNANKEFLSFNTFIRNLFNDIVSSNLTNNVVNFAPSRKINCSVTHLTSNVNEEIEQELIKNYNNTNIKRYYIDFEGSNYRKSNFYKFKNSIITSKKEMFGSSNSTFEVAPRVNYLFILSTSEKDLNLNSSYDIDADKNIPHFYIGDSKGIVKNIKFTREDNKQLDAANIIKANKGNNSTQIIRQIYQSQIEMFGNTIFEPGQLIHIVPTYPGTRLKNETLYKVGLGGYYRIISVSNSIQDSLFRTTLDTKWELSGLGIEKEFDSFVDVLVESKKENS